MRRSWACVLAIGVAVGAAGCGSCPRQEERTRSSGSGYRARVHVRACGIVTTPERLEVDLIRVEDDRHVEVLDIIPDYFDAMPSWTGPSDLLLTVECDGTELRSCYNPEKSIGISKRTSAMGITIRYALGPNLQRLASDDLRRRLLD